jgi:hypothetical protein
VDFEVSGVVESFTENFGGNTVSLGQSVGVAVERHCRLGVTMTFGHGTDVYSGRQQSRDRKVTEPVEVEIPPFVGC